MDWNQQNENAPEPGGRLGGNGDEWQGIHSDSNYHPSRSQVNGNQCIGPEELREMIMHRAAEFEDGSLAKEKTISGNAQASPTGSAVKKVEPIDVLHSLDVQPPQKKFIVRGYVPHEATGLLVGTGGTGKSYMILIMAAAIASGKIIPPFEPPQPARVLLLNVEDPADDLARRLHYVGQEYEFSGDERELLRKNLIILPGRGQVGPLMRRDNAAGCPVGTDDAAWLRQQIEQHDPALVILDTKSRLYGLDENSNDDGSQWIGLLETMLVDHPQTTFLIVAHTAKHSAQSGDQHSNRGASSVTDNTRFSLVLCEPQDSDMRLLDGSDGDEFIKLIHAKASNAKKCEPVFFRKNPFGVPVYEELRDARAESISLALDRLVTILREDHPGGLNKRDLERGSEVPGKMVKQESLANTGLRGKDWMAVISFGIESTRLETFEDDASPGNHKPILVRARRR